MIKIEPNNSTETILIDDDDYGVVAQYNWYTHKKKKDNTSYARTNVYKNKKQLSVSMHRLIMNAQYGDEIDHINGNGLDNQRKNLRFCSHKENLRNQRKSVRNKSGYKGVSLFKKGNFIKWRAVIQFEDKYITLGYFDSVEDAAKEYDIAAKKYFGEFANINA